MKQEYEKPRAEYVELSLNNTITNDVVLNSGNLHGGMIDLEDIMPPKP